MKFTYNDGGRKAAVVALTPGQRMTKVMKAVR